MHPMRQLYASPYSRQIVLACWLCFHIDDQTVRDIASVHVNAEELSTVSDRAVLW